MVYYSVLTLLVSWVSDTPAGKSPSPSCNPWTLDDPGLFFLINPEGIHECMSLDLSSLDPLLRKVRKTSISMIMIAAVVIDRSKQATIVQEHGSVDAHSGQEIPPAMRNLSLRLEEGSG